MGRNFLVKSQMVCLSVLFVLLFIRLVSIVGGSHEVSDSGIDLANKLCSNNGGVDHLSFKDGAVVCTNDARFFIDLNITD